MSDKARSWDDERPAVMRRIAREEGVKVRDGVNYIRVWFVDEEADGFLLLRSLREEGWIKPYRLLTDPDAPVHFDLHSSECSGGCDFV